VTEPAPRIPQIRSDEESAAVREVLTVFEAGPWNHVVRTFAHHPELARLFLTFNRHLLRTSTLEPRIRQIAIMRATWIRHATYMWSSHLRMSTLVGLSAADFEAARQGPDSPHWSPLERDVVRAVDEFNAHSVLSDATWDALAAQLDRRQMLDLLFTIGTYAMAASVINTLRIDREPELQALAAQFGAPELPVAPAPTAAPRRLERVDLRADPQAASYVKQEIVDVRFATTDGELRSRVGPNRYCAGDALITGTDGDTWSVTRARFDAAYEPEAPLQSGQAGRYRNRPRPVLARQMSENFAVQRAAGADWLEGKAGDWLLQYAPGDHGLAAAARFARVYRRTS